MHPRQIGKLSISTAKGYLLIDIAAIECIESVNEKSLFTIENKENEMASERLIFYENELKGFNFERVHQQALVNLNKIAEYRQKEDLLILQSGKKLSTSREKGKIILKFLRGSVEDAERTQKLPTVTGILAVNDKDYGKQICPVTKGVHMVGRKNIAKPCAIMFETADLSMSRNHFTIESRETATGEIDTFILLEQDVNETLLNGEIMLPGKEYPLGRQSRIIAGQTEITFEKR